MRSWGYSRNSGVLVFWSFKVLKFWSWEFLIKKYSCEVFVYSVDGLWGEYG